MHKCQNEIPITMRQYKNGDFDGTYALGMRYAIPGTAEYDAFNSKFGEDHNGYSAFGYDLTYMVWNGLQDGPQQVLAHVQARPYSGLIGTVATNATNRQISLPLTVLYVQNGTLRVS